MFTETVQELPGCPVQNCPSGSFLFQGGLSAGGGGDNTVYDNVQIGSPRMTPWAWTMLRTPVWIRILSTSLTSVSVFSVWCYSSVSISVLCTLSNQSFDFICSRPQPYTETEEIFNTHQLLCKTVQLQMLFSNLFKGFQESRTGQQSVSFPPKSKSTCTINVVRFT